MRKLYETRVDLNELDTTAICRCLAQIADRESDVADAYFEWREDVELPAEGETPGIRVWQERGLAVRLLRRGQTWLASRDGIDTISFQAAVRQVARAMPAASYQTPVLDVGPAQEPVEAPEVLSFPSMVQRLLQNRLVGFPQRLTVRRHRRRSRVLGTRLASEPQHERFYSCVAELPWGRHGCVLPSLDEEGASALVEGLMGLFRAREAAPPEPAAGAVVLGPQAAAVLLHEAVAHALETDTLVLGGRPSAAVGVHIGAEVLGVLDDPGSLPAGIRRTADDEGMPVVRRWLVRDGTVEQPLADRFAASASSQLTPGAARRGSRHEPPVPRSSHLELVPGEDALEELLVAADGGLFAPLAARGRLDSLRGDFTLVLPFVRRVRNGRPAEHLGPARLGGRVAELLGAIKAVGSETSFAGAGWCAKGGQKLPVWATAPAVLLEGVAIS